jgi:hypothetical protein
MSTSQVNPAPFEGPGNDPQNDPDLATPPVRTPDRDNPLIEQAEPSPDEVEEDDPNDQLPRD